MKDLDCLSWKKAFPHDFQLDWGTNTNAPSVPLIDVLLRLCSPTGRLDYQEQKRPICPLIIEVHVEGDYVAQNP